MLVLENFVLFYFDDFIFFYFLLNLKILFFINMSVGFFFLEIFVNFVYKFIDFWFVNNLCVSIFFVGVMVYLYYFKKLSWNGNKMVIIFVCVFNDFNYLYILDLFKNEFWMLEDNCFFGVIEYLCFLDLLENKLMIIIIL